MSPLIKEELTKEEIENVLGPVDDDLAFEVQTAGANAEELKTAHAWIVNDEALVNDLRPFPTGRVAQLCEILRESIYDGDD